MQVRGCIFETLAVSKLNAARSVTRIAGRAFFFSNDTKCLMQLLYQFQQNYSANVRFRSMEESEGFARKLSSRGALVPTTNNFFP